MPVTWLHVSDFHIREGDPYDRHVVLRALVASVRRMREQNGRKPDLIFVTGDIAFSGKPAEYKMATRFFDELLEAADVERKNLFVIPGNHDVDRTLAVGLARTLETREEADAYFGPKVPKVHITQKLGAFVKWHNKYFRGIRSVPNRTTCGPVEVIEVGGTKIGILLLNSALFCQGDDDHAKLLIGRRALDPALERLRESKADLNVALIHHPLDWLSEIEDANIRASLQANVDVLLRGQLHKSDIESTVSASGGYLHMAAGAAYQTRRWPNRALYATFDGTAVTVFPIRYEDQPREIWVVDPSMFPEAADYEWAFPIPRLAAKPAAVRALAKQPAPLQASTGPISVKNPSRNSTPSFVQHPLIEDGAQGSSAQESSSKPKVFISYAREDVNAALELYQSLNAAGFDAWIDQERLEVGQLWEREISRVLRSSDFVILCLSRHLVHKRGFVQHELKMALDAYRQLPEGQAFLLPVRFDDCMVPDELSRFHYADLFRPGGIQRLIRAIDSQWKPVEATRHLVALQPPTC